MTKTPAKRLLWIVNHQTLMGSEVPILRSLGWEVFVPKVVPDAAAFRSAAVTYEFDAGLTLPETALAALNLQDFYRHSWAPTVQSIINAFFDVAVIAFTNFTMPLSEAARKFDGMVVARVFGREHPSRFSHWPGTPRPALLDELAAIGDRFVFAQGFAHLAEIEDEPLRGCAQTVVQALPRRIYEHAGSWRGDGSEALFLCPFADQAGYYAGVYRGIKETFGDLPHRIFGRQLGEVDDPAVLSYLSDEELMELYASTPVFVYPSSEPRHVHLAAIEAMVVGTPVVCRRGALLDQLAGGRLPGACGSDAELRATAVRLLAHDRDLADRIQTAQARIVEAFSDDLSCRQWQSLLARSRA